MSRQGTSEADPVGSVVSYEPAPSVFLEVQAAIPHDALKVLVCQRLDLASWLITIVAIHAYMVSSKSPAVKLLGVPERRDGCRRTAHRRRLATMAKCRPCWG